MYYMSMKTKAQPKRKVPERMELAFINYGNNQRILAKVRRSRSLKDFTSIESHEASCTDEESGKVSRLGLYPTSGSSMFVGMAAILLLKEGDDIHTEFYENKTYIEKIISKHLDCILMEKGKDQPRSAYAHTLRTARSRQELNFIKFTRYLQRELENKWKWRDTSQLVLVKIIRTSTEYKIVPVPLCAIDIQQSIDIKYANSLCDLIERVVEAVVESMTVEECFEKIISDYKQCEVKATVEGNYKIIISAVTAVIAGAVPVLLEKIF